MADSTAGQPAAGSGVGAFYVGDFIRGRIIAGPFADVSLAEAEQDSLNIAGDCLVLRKVAEDQAGNCDYRVVTRPV